MRGTELGLLPPGLSQPLEETSTGGAIERTTYLRLRDTGGLPHDHYVGAGRAGKDRARGDGITRLQTSLAGLHVGVKGGQFVV